MNNEYADLIIPLPLAGTFTYCIPDKFKNDIKLGIRVLVQFGNNKYYAAIVNNLHNNKPSHTKIKYIEYIIDIQPIVTINQLILWDWISQYYMSNIGLVMKNALPSSLKLESESQIILNLEKKIDIKSLNDDEYIIYEALLIRNILSLNEVSELIEKKNYHIVLRDMVNKEMIQFIEEIQEKYKVKKQKYIELNHTLIDNNTINSNFEQLTRSPKQEDAYIQIIAYFQKNNSLLKSHLINKYKVSSITIKSLEKKSIIKIVEKQSNRVENYTGEINEISELNIHQQKAFEEINTHFISNNNVLLKGVTGSGKTEIYIHQIIKEIENNKQVLYLLPEIALTTQIIQRLRKNFGDKVAVFHSKFNINQRTEIWHELLKKENSKYKIIIGARSSIFLPFYNLGLIIIDEEHDQSYKQQNPSPRYNARDTALYYSTLFNSKVILGSATPSLESLYNCTIGKINLVNLNHRYNELELPEIKIVELKKNKQLIFSDETIKEIKNTLKEKKQIIVFQNRRGFDLLWICENCSWIPSCKNCNINLTYHKENNYHKCHYCNYTLYNITHCESCNKNSLKTIGVGTQKVVEELNIIFPQAKIKRMDYDNTKTKNSHQRIIAEFENQDIDILVGTQMISKGFDFDNVKLVIVVNGDMLLVHNDFRTNEKAFQMLTQVAGRSGRKHEQGLVIIQTYNTNHYIYKYVKKNEFEKFVKNEILERKKYGYSPFYKHIMIEIKDKKLDSSLQNSCLIANKLKEKLNNRITGPIEAPILRIKNEYIHHIFIKYDRKISEKKIKIFVSDTIIELKNLHKIKSTIHYNVDFY